MVQSKLTDIEPGKSRIFAHIGLPKTGTTFLQKHFFPNLGFDFYSTEREFRWPAELNWIYETNAPWLGDFRGRHALQSRSEREGMFALRIERHYSNWIRRGKRWKQKQAATVLLSAEGFAGLSLPIAKISASIMEEIGVGKVVFVFRNQVDWSLSYWRQLVLREDFFARFISYEALFGDPPDPRVPCAIDMDWAEYLAIFQASFGKQNVLALPYELLCLNSEKFYKCIRDFLNIANINSHVVPAIENPSVLNERYTGWKSDENPFLAPLPAIRRRLHKYLTPIAARVPVFSRLMLNRHESPNISTQRRAEIMSRFEASNRRLAKLSGISLDTYDYY